MRFYEVGGCVRDDLLGRKPNDTDFVAVLEEGDKLKNDEDDAYSFMCRYLLNHGFSIIRESPQFGTLKARASGFTFGGRLMNDVYDFVVARRDIGSGNGRHPTSVAFGSLEDDLRRRDFTMNAIARGEDGVLIDPFGGQRDIENKRIAPVGDALTRFREDNLRILRALRFHVTLGFGLCDDIYVAIYKMINESGTFSGVSDERMRDEMLAMFKCNTARSVEVLARTRLLHLFEKRLWLKPSLDARS